MFGLVFLPLSKVEQLKQTTANLPLVNEGLTAPKGKRERNLLKECAYITCPIKITIVPAVKQCLVELRGL